MNIINSNKSKLLLLLLLAPIFLWAESSAKIIPKPTVQIDEVIKLSQSKLRLLAKNDMDDYIIRKMVYINGKQLLEDEDMIEEKDLKNMKIKKDEWFWQITYQHRKQDAISYTYIVTKKKEVTLTVVTQ